MPNRRAHLIFATLAWSAILLAPPAFAAGGACKPGVFLTVGGRISKASNATDKTYEFTEAEIRALPSATITTSTAWTEKSKFDGPRLSEILKRVGASGTSLRVLAFDNYTAEIPWSDLTQYAPILALSQNDTKLTRKDHGPMFVVYPRDEFPKVLNLPMAQMRYVWQVCRIDVE